MRNLLVLIVVLFSTSVFSAGAGWYTYSTTCYADPSSAMASCSASYAYCGTEGDTQYGQDCSRIYFATENPCPQGEPVPGTTECNGCPNGQLEVTHPDGSKSCFAYDETPDDDCQDVAGSINGKQICDDDRNDCADSGGAYGCAGYGDSMNCGCYQGGDDVPECAGNGVIIITEAGYVCESPDPGEGNQPDPDDPDGDGQTNANDDDDDNDGVPDSADDDANGDGVPDSDTDGDGVKDYVDSDIDGDGIPNANDPDADGDGEKDTGPCDPTEANYAECIGLGQGDNSDLIEEVAEGKADDLYNDSTSAGLGHINTAMDGLESDLNGTFDGGDVIPSPTGIGDSLAAAFQIQTSCSNLSMNLPQYNLVITCEGTSEIRTLLFWVLNIITAIYLFHVVTQKVPE